MYARNLRRVGTAVQIVGPGAATAAAPGAVPPLPASVTAIAGRAEPATNLPGRGVTGATVHIGVGETVDLSFAAAALPPGYRLRWQVSVGDADILMPNANPTKVTALPTAGNFTVCLVVEGGPHNGHKLFEKEFKVVAPTGTQTRQQPGTNIRHTTGLAGVGFKMWINILPADVVFDALQWREHIGLGLATGHFKSENNRIHAPTGVPYNTKLQPTSFLSKDWMPVYGVHPAPYGVNWIGTIDTVDTGDRPPAVPASPGVPAQWNQSSHKWDIEWRYRVKRANGSYSGEYVLERSMHEATIKPDGTATIQKGSAGPFTLPAGAPTTRF